MSRETISQRHHISKSFISDGTKKLSELNLIEIKYGNLEGANYNERDANEYTPKPLYDPEDLKKDLQKLEQRYGKDKLERAIKTAGVVFEQNNPRTIQALIDLEDQYGQSIIEEAAKKIAEKNPDNPKRSTGYLINTIKSMAKKHNANPSH